MCCPITGFIYVSLAAHDGGLLLRLPLRPCSHLSGAVVNAGGATFPAFTPGAVYGPSYGIGCAAHDNGLAPFCDLDRESWCNSPWCWVNASECAPDFQPTPSSYFEGRLGLTYCTCHAMRRTTSSAFTRPDTSICAPSSRWIRMRRAKSWARRRPATDCAARQHESPGRVDGQRHQCALRRPWLCAAARWRGVGPTHAPALHLGHVSLRRMGSCRAQPEPLPLREQPLRCRGRHGERLPRRRDPGAGRARAGRRQDVLHRPRPAERAAWSGQRGGRRAVHLLDAHPQRRVRASRTRAAAAAALPRKERRDRRRKLRLPGQSVLCVLGRGDRAPRGGARVSGGAQRDGGAATRFARVRV